MEQSQRNEHLHACARTFNMFSINRWRLLCYKCYNFPLFCELAELLSHVSLKEARLHYTLPTSSSAWWLPHRHPEAQTCAVFTYSPPYPFTLSLPLIMAINNDDNVPFFLFFFYPCGYAMHACCSNVSWSWQFILQSRLFCQWYQSWPLQESPEKMYSSSRS